MLSSSFCLLQSIYVAIDCIGQQAAIPIIVYILGGILVLCIISGLIWSGESPTTTYKLYKKVNLTILGSNEVGKTTLWNYLKGKPTSKTYYETVGKERISIVCSDKIWDASISEPDKKWRIDGWDINGHGDFIRLEWEGLIKNSDMVIFIFNTKKYLSDVSSQRDVNQRLQFIKNTIDKYQKIDGKMRKVWLLGSFADLLSNKKDDWRKILEIINSKPYGDLARNSACLNLTDEKVLAKYCKKMFDI